jgi:hypothetical protein
MTPGADTYYSGTVLPVADAAGVPVGAAITVGYPLAETLIPEFQGWVNAGRDVTSHSISHTYYTNTDALDVQYTGSGTAATLSISSKVLTITVTGASDSVSYNLAQGQTEGTILELQQALAATGKFTTSYLTPCQGPYGTGCSAYTAQALLAQDLADVSGQDVKSAVYHLQLNVTRLTTDEITLSRQWMTANLTGLPATTVYVYPGGYETTAMQGITEGVPYNGARGALKEDLGVKDTYADGFNVQNITSFGVNPSWMGVSGVTPAMLNQKIQALVWKEAVWGVPWGIFWHLNELTNDDPVGGTEITNLIQDFKASGATIQTNTGLVNWLLGGTQETGTDGNYYYTFPATSMVLDFRPTRNSPIVDAGQNLGAAYELDINGVNQNSYGSGWEIGAHVYEGYAVYGTGTAGSEFAIGTNVMNGPPNYAGSCTSLATIPPPAAAPFSGLVGAGTIVMDPEPVSGGNTSGCFHNPMVRVTDASSGCGGVGEPSAPCSKQNFSFYADAGGSGDVNHWSVNDSSFYIADQGTTLMFYSFDPATLAATLKYADESGVGAVIPVSAPSYSRVTPDLLYAFMNSGSTAKGSILKSYSVASDTAPTTPATVVDFASFAGGLAPGTWFTTDPVSGNNNDTIFADGFSPDGVQNDARMACGWTNGVGIDCWNTLTNTISSSYGPTGAVECQNCPNGATQIGTTGIHNVKASLDGKYVIMAPGGTPDGETIVSVTSGTGGAVSAVVSSTTIFFVGAVVQVTGNSTSGFNNQTFNISAINSGTNTITGTGWAGTASSSGTGGSLNFSLGNNPFVWERGTLKVWTLCDPAGGHCSGHWVGGYEGFANQYSTPYYAYRTFANPAAVTTFPASTFTGLCGADSEVNDSHPGWNNNTGLDQEPFLTTATSGPDVPSYTNCDVNEVLGIFAPSNTARSGNTVRFAHTGGEPTTQFSGEYTIGSGSQTGRFYLFGSPYYNALGDSSGNQPCSVPPCRTDVFIVDLAPAAQNPEGVALWGAVMSAGQSSLYPALISDVLPDANITAVAPGINWNAVESNSTPGSYSWTTVDSQLLALTATGKRLRLLVQLATESGAAYTSTSGNHSTPNYVFGSSWAATVGASNALDMTVCANFPGDTASPYGQTGFSSGGVWNSSNATYGTDLSGFPVSYELPFKTAAKSFISQVVEHFSSACAIYSSDCTNAATLAAQMDYLRVGFSAGAENSPLCINYWPLPGGYTTFQGAYLDGSNSGGQTGYVDEMTAYIANAMATYHPPWTFIFDTHDMAGTGHTYADHEAQVAATAGYGFGTDGLQIADLTNCPGANCTADWYTNFSAYPSVPHILQTLTATCPDNSCAAGSLVSLLSFAAEHGASAFELYPCDLLLADAPSMYPGTGAQACSPVFPTATYSAAYNSAVTQANAGLFSVRAPAGVTGTTK